MHIVDIIRSINSFDESIGSGIFPSKCPCRRSFCLNEKNETYKDENRYNDLLEDNQVKFRPFEDGSMHKLIQREENIFPHLSIVDL